METARRTAAGARHLRQRVAELEEEVELLRAENARLRRLLNDPDRMIQRGLRLLAGTAAAVLSLPPPS